MVRVEREEGKKENEMAVSLLKTTGRREGRMRRKMGLNIQQTTSHLKSKHGKEKKGKKERVQTGT